jgi:hypothetical protein
MLNLKQMIQLVPEGVGSYLFLDSSPFCRCTFDLRLQVVANKFLIYGTLLCHDLLYNSPISQLNAILNDKCHWYDAVDTETSVAA